MFKQWHKCNHKISFSVASVTIIRRKKKDRMSINKINYFYLNVFLDFFSIRDKWVNYNHSLLRSYYVGGGHRFTWLYCIAILLTDIIKHQTLVTEDPKKIENREASGKKKESLRGQENRKYFRAAPRYDWLHMLYCHSTSCYKRMEWVRKGGQRIRWEGRRN